MRCSFEGCGAGHSARRCLRRGLGRLWRGGSGSAGQTTMTDVLGIGKAVEKLADPVVDIIKKVAGPAAEEIGLTLQDSIRVYRAKRQYRLFEKIRDFVKEAGFEPKRIPRSEERRVG